MEILMLLFTTNTTSFMAPPREALEERLQVSQSCEHILQGKAQTSVKGGYPVAEASFDPPENAQRL